MGVQVGVAAAAERRNSSQQPAGGSSRKCTEAVCPHSSVLVLSFNTEPNTGIERSPAEHLARGKVVHSAIQRHLDCDTGIRHGKHGKKAV